MSGIKCLICGLVSAEKNHITAKVTYYEMCNSKYNLIPCCLSCNRKTGVYNACMD